MISDRIKDAHRDLRENNPLNVLSLTKNEFDTLLKYSLADLYALVQAQREEIDVLVELVDQLSAEKDKRNRKWP